MTFFYLYPITILERKQRQFPSCCASSPGHPTRCRPGSAQRLLSPSPACWTKINVHHMISSLHIMFYIWKENISYNSLLKSYPQVPYAVNKAYVKVVNFPIILLLANHMVHHWCLKLLNLEHGNHIIQYKFTFSRCDHSLLIVPPVVSLRYFINLITL